MSFKKHLKKYSLISQKDKKFELVYKNNIRLKFNLVKRDSFPPANYENKTSRDLIFYDKIFEKIKKWYLINVVNNQFIINKEILGSFDHISLHNLKGESSQSVSGQRRLYNFHYKDDKNIGQKIEILGNPNNYNDMGLFHILRTGKKYGLPNKKESLEEIHFVQNFDPERFSINVFNNIFNEFSSLEKSVVLYIKRLFDDIPYRRYFYSFKTNSEIQEFEKLFSDETFMQKINKVNEEFKILQISDTRYNILLHFSSINDNQSPYFEVKNKIIQAGIYNKKLNSFCILGHVSSDFSNNKIIVGCF